MATGNILINFLHGNRKHVQGKGIREWRLCLLLHGALTKSALFTGSPSALWWLSRDRSKGTDGFGSGL